VPIAILIQMTGSMEHEFAYDQWFRIKFNLLNKVKVLQILIELWIIYDR
jgi:hypothetical protein